jgi:hypothetical protein
MLLDPSLEDNAKALEDLPKVPTQFTRFTSTKVLVKLYK